MDIKIKPYPIICIILPFMFVSCGGESGPEQKTSKADPALEQTVSEAETEWTRVPFKKIDDWVEAKKLRKNV